MQRKSQKGRRKGDSGQGSRDAAGLAMDLLGVPGEVSECTYFFYLFVPYVCVSFGV